MLLVDAATLCRTPGVSCRVTLYSRVHFDFFSRQAALTTTSFATTSFDKKYCLGKRAHTWNMANLPNFSEVSAIQRILT